MCTFSWDKRKGYRGRDWKWGVKFREQNSSYIATEARVERGAGAEKHSLGQRSARANAEGQGLSTETMPDNLHREGWRRPEQEDIWGE